MSAEVVRQHGSTVQFRGGLDTRIGIGFELPRDTMDPRYRDCVRHRTACICREAEHSEELNEVRAELRNLADTLKSAAADHPTRVYIGNDRRRDLECRCVACVVLRNWGGVSLWDNEVHL